MKRNKSGFTLIELLVVIAIIAILAAILFPIFVNAQKASQASGCVSNLKQLGSAITMYKDSYNSSIFNPKSGSAYWVKPADNATPGWTQKLFPFVEGGIGVYRCPSKPKAFAYSFNDNIKNFDQVAVPSKAVFIAECPGSGDANMDLKSQMADNTNWKNFANSPADKRYPGNTNQACGTGPYNYFGVGVNQTMTPDKWIPDPSVKHKDYWLPAANGTTFTGNESDRRGNKHRLILFPGPHNGANNMLFGDLHVASFKGFTYKEIGNNKIMSTSWYVDSLVR